MLAHISEAVNQQLDRAERLAMLADLLDQAREQLYAHQRGSDAHHEWRWIHTAVHNEWIRVYRHQPRPRRVPRAECRMPRAERRA